MFSVALAAVASHADAQAAKFVFASGESKVQFVSEAPLERITGATTRVTGQIQLDPAAPAQAHAEIDVPVASIKTNNDLRDEHLRSDSWLDAARFPTVHFALSSVAGLDSLPLDQSTSANVRGKLSVHGITRELACAAKVRLSQSDGRRTLRVQAQFPVALEAHKISIPSLVKLKVAPVIQVNVDLHAHASTPADAAPERAVTVDAAVDTSAPQARPIKKPMRAGQVAASAGSDAASADAGTDGSLPPDSAVAAPLTVEPSAPAVSSAAPSAREQTPQSASREGGCSAVPGVPRSWPLLLSIAWLLRRRRRLRSVPPA